jgi:hypothetical protein
MPIDNTNPSPGTSSCVFVFSLPLDVVVSDGVFDTLLIVTVVLVADSTSAGATGADRTFTGFAGLIGLTGLNILFAFVIVILHVSEIVTHSENIGMEYGVEHEEVFNCVTTPSYPGKHDSFLDSVIVWQVAGAGWQLLLTSYHPESIGEP